MALLLGSAPRGPVLGVQGGVGRAGLPPRRVGAGRRPAAPRRRRRAALGAGGEDLLLQRGPVLALQRGEERGGPGVPQAHRRVEGGAGRTAGGLHQPGGM